MSSGPAFGTLCFFFQAEDGIRDLTVTGVQTCALPISPYRSDISVFGEGAMSQVKTKAEAHEWILTHVRQRRGCQDFSQEFRLLGKGPEWECIPTNCYDCDALPLADLADQAELLGEVLA